MLELPHRPCWGFHIMLILLLGILTMCAFAANSVLTRAALADGAIDAVDFTAVRLLSGAGLLAILMLVRNRQALWDAMREATPWPTVALFAYALFFSLSYNWLATGTGAVILFAFVQFTMLAVSYVRGTRFLPVELLGIVVAFAGLVYLMLPGLTAPDPLGAVLMAVAGIAWGAYTLLGRGAVDPTAATARNFLFSVPLVAALLIGAPAFQASPVAMTAEGFWLAVTSGAVTSGLGYALWYWVLRHIAVTVAAVAQLSAPMIAAVGGVVFVAEDLTWRLVISGVAILGGILMTILKPGLKPGAASR